MGDGGGVVGMSARHEYVCDTRGSSIISNTFGVLGMSVVRGMKGIYGLCEMCMYLARGGVRGERGEWIRGLGWALLIPWGKRECWMYICV